MLVIWWITGFNPEYVGNVDVTKQVMIGSVDFTGHKEMYEALKDCVTVKNPQLKDFIIFDRTNLTAWIIWYERDLI